MWETNITSQLLNFVTIGNFPIVHNNKKPMDHIYDSKWPKTWLAYVKSTRILHNPTL
jgi:hypothetical protein